PVYIWIHHSYVQTYSCCELATHVRAILRPRQSAVRADAQPALPVPVDGPSRDLVVTPLRSDDEQGRHAPARRSGDRQDDALPRIAPGAARGGGERAAAQSPLVGDRAGRRDPGRPRPRAAWIDAGRVDGGGQPVSPGRGR